MNLTNAKRVWPWVLSVVIPIPAVAQEVPEARDLPIAGFAFDLDLSLPGSPEIIYDAFTGDISGWWDHTFSDAPRALYIEPKPGGAFMELFDESGDGVRHATVTAAKRGELLRLEGPLGLAGNALDMVHTIAFEAVGDSTRLALAVRGAGQIEEGWKGAVARVWWHFLVERFKPFVESGRHLRSQ